MTEMGRTISLSLVVSPWHWKSRILAWPIRLLHMHRRIIIANTLVTEMKWKLTWSKIGTRIAFQIESSSQIQIWVFISPEIQELSPCLCRNLIAIWQWAWDAIRWGWSLWVQHALITELVTNRAFGCVGGTDCLRVSVASVNLAPFDYSLVEKSLAALAI